MKRKRNDDKVKDCYEALKPHIGYTFTRPGFVLTSSGTIEPFPKYVIDRTEFFQNNLEV